MRDKFRECGSGGIIQKTGFAALVCVLAFTQSSQGAVQEQGLTLEQIKRNNTIVTPADKERISLDLKGVEINELFNMLSVKAGITIIATPEVKGRVTVFMDNLTIDEALDVIVTTQNLAYERKGSLVKVMTTAEYEKAYGKKFDERKEARTIKLAYAKPSNIVNVINSLKSDIGKIIVDESSGTLLIIDSPQAIVLMEAAIKELDQPLETAVFDINYAKTQDIKAYLADLITPGLGQVIIDERSRKAIVSDLSKRIDKIKKLMKELDEESRQVLISADIVELTLSDKFSRGINWEGLFANKQLHNLDLAGSFQLANLTAAQKVSVGTLATDNYTAVLNLLEEYGKTRIISQPRIVAVNNEQAKIMVGTRDAYVTQTLSQAQTSTVTSENIQFIDVGVKLNVTPTINKDGFITMKIKPEVSSVQSVLETKLGSQIPIVQTSEAESVVKVKDGAMIMIAGLIKNESDNKIVGTPFLSRIPFIGALFSNRVKDNPKTQLIVFITPRIIRGDVSEKPESLSETTENAKKPKK